MHLICLFQVYYRYQKWGCSVSAPESASDVQFGQQRMDGRVETSSIADAIFTLTRQHVYALLSGQPNRQFFVTEIIDLTGGGRRGAKRACQAREDRPRLCIKSWKSSVLPSQSKLADIRRSMCNCSNNPSGISVLGPGARCAC